MNRRTLLFSHNIRRRFGADLSQQHTKELEFFSDVFFFFFFSGLGRIPFGKASDGVFAFETCTITHLAFLYLEDE
jgi:hypothetical protein